MHIFLDESGAFIPAEPPRSKVSCVAALAIPGSQLGHLIYDFDRWRESEFGAVCEIKGASLSESHVAQVIDIAARYDVLFDACCVDAGAHTPRHVETFKLAQAAKLEASVGADNLPSLREEIARYATRLKGLSNQLFIQWFCAIVLHQNLLEQLINYYGLVHPEELASFVWRIDPKAKTITAFEELWSDLSALFLSNIFAQQPMALIPGTDLSHLDAAFPAETAAVAEALARVDPALRGRARSTGDITSLITRDRAYEESTSSSGIQLVDILAAALTRACNGSLQQEGWEQLGKLTIRRNPQTLRLIALSESAPSPFRRVISVGSWATVLARLHAGARAMPIPECHRSRFRV